jgi:hypothetical protein
VVRGSTAPMRPRGNGSIRGTQQDERET